MKSSLRSCKIYIRSVIVIEGGEEEEEDDDDEDEDDDVREDRTGEDRRE